MTALICGAGTAEERWRHWLAANPFPDLDLARLPAGRVVALAAHPDDEVLGVAGLLRLLAGAGARIDVVWATDGEASHPGSSVPPARLAERRVAEAAAGLAALGLARSGRHRLRLPDSGLTGHEPALAAALAEHLAGAALVLCPWEGDGHPDHEAVARAALRLAGPAPVLRYPVWAWHWAAPGDGRVPWSRARRVPLPAAVLAAKRAAVAAHRSQLHPLGPAAADRAVLPPAVLARFLRPAETVFA